MELKAPRLKFKYLVILAIVLPSTYLVLQLKLTPHLDIPLTFKSSTADLNPKVFGANNVEKILENGGQVDEIEYELAELVRSQYMKGPPPGQEYHLKDNAKEDYSRGQSSNINAILEMKKSGFFVEIGAGDGEIESVSLYFEKVLDWSGLLIEPNPTKMAELVSKNRKATTLRACVNGDRFAIKKIFQGNKIVDTINKQLKEPATDTMCFPFLTIVTALGKRQIDLLAINVNGREMAILTSIPFNLIDIYVISVEFQEGMEGDLVTFMSAKGYKAVNMMDNKVLNKKDLIFRKLKNR